MTTEVAPPKRRGRRGKKSEAIRAYFAEHVDAGPTEVVNKLAEQGIKVTATLVSNVKSRMKHSTTPSKRGPGRPPRVSTDSISVAALVEAKRFVDQIGSLEAAKLALETVSKLRG
jgi:hypothetical protein